MPEFAGLETIDFLHAGFEAEDGRAQPDSMPSGELIIGDCWSPGPANDRPDSYFPAFTD